MKIQEFYDEDTSTLSYVLFDTDTKDAVVIDPVWDFDASGGLLAETSIDRIMSFIGENNLKVHYLLETHAHADHLSGSYVIQRKYLPEAVTGIGLNIVKVQKVFKSIFNLGDEFKPDGMQFDRLFADGEQLTAGSLQFKVLFTPGHTPACASYLFDDVLFVGDAMFMPDFGTGRCDFPAGDASVLYDSITQKIYALPDETRIFVGHDYCPNGRKLKFMTSVGEQKQQNLHVRENTSRDDFVAFRNSRDKELSAPNLLYPSVQVNIAGGRLPPPETKDQVFLKLPIVNPFFSKT